MIKASQTASTTRDGRPLSFDTILNWLGSATCKFETALFRTAKGYDRARRARVRRSRSSIQDVGALAEAVCSNRNLSAQARRHRQRAMAGLSLSIPFSIGLAARHAN